MLQIFALSSVLVGVYTVKEDLLCDYYYCCYLLFPGDTACPGG